MEFLRELFRKKMYYPAITLDTMRYGRNKKVELLENIKDIHGTIVASKGEQGIIVSHNIVRGTVAVKLNFGEPIHAIHTTFLKIME